ncbi:unnamed protein product [Closterium sp. Yama58-4]|nr:unnamed protein product [Closterium sp. Yama58-4]
MNGGDDPTRRYMDGGDDPTRRYMDGGDDSSRRYTVDEALSAVGFGAFHWLLLGYAGLAWAAEAMELLLLSFIAAPAAAHWGVGGDGEAALSSVVFGGMLVGAFAWGLLADSRGRSAAELPGLLLSAFIVDRVGRRTTIAAMLAAAALALLPLLLHSLLPGLSVLALAARPAATVAALFVARAAIMGSFQTLFMFAPELNATSVRSSGLGFASSFSRLGGIVCPYVAVTLVQGCQLSTALSLFVAVPLTAAIATTFFPVETARRALIEVHVEDGEYGGQNDREISRNQGVVKEELRSL